MVSRSPYSSVKTGIPGLDSILSGGYPEGSPILLRGSSGTGKTLVSLMFACANSSTSQKTVYGTFDEHPERLRGYVRQLGFEHKPHFIDFRPQFGDELLSGEIELGGLLVRIEHAVKKAQARCLVLDSFDLLFGHYNAHSSIRRDLHHLFNWCRDRGLTLLATSGEEADYLPGTDLVDYASDAMIHLRQQITDGLMTRYLHVHKARGRLHGTNEYPYLISEKGISVMPVTGIHLTSPGYRQYLTTGNASLDTMLGGKGIWRGSVVMVSGQSGTGKSIIASSIAVTHARLDKRVNYYSFEESATQIKRNLKSIGMDIKPLMDSNKLVIRPLRSVECGMEEHLIRIIRDTETDTPDIIVLDPVTALTDIATESSFKNSILRLVHLLKEKGITVILTELLPDHSASLSTLNISSMVDTWIRLRQQEINAEFIRLIHIHKSRGHATRRNTREFSITHKGISIEAPYTGTGEVVFGSRKAALTEDARVSVNELMETIKWLKQSLKINRQYLKKAESMDRYRIELQIVDLEHEIKSHQAQLDHAYEAKSEAQRRRS